MPMQLVMKIVENELHWNLSDISWPWMELFSLNTLAKKEAGTQAS